jgi:hypothetical protein
MRSPQTRSADINYMHADSLQRPKDAQALGENDLRNDRMRLGGFTDAPKLDSRKLGAATICCISIQDKTRRVLTNNPLHSLVVHLILDRKLAHTKKLKL